MKTQIPFTKMQGAGNDYVYINGFETELPSNLARLAVRISDRHFGVGGDGMIVILPSDKADCRMRMFNADGSEGEMCGNGVRCVAKYAYDHNITQKNPLTVETGAGVLSIDLILGKDQRVARARVNMGSPILESGRIPTTFMGERVVDHPLKIDGHTYKVTCVSMGNPHCVVFVDDVDRFPVETIGPLFENHPAFPNRTNTEFVQVLADGTLKQRTWERGSGETLACGTGACAVTVAAHLNSLSSRSNTVHLRGGDLLIEWSEEGPVFMTGEAVEVFEGIYTFGD